MRRRLAAALLSAVLAVSSTAGAVPMQLGPANKAKYSDGVKKQSAGEYRAALAAFESIPVADRSYDTRLHLASCKARLGRLIDAAAELEEIINLAKGDKLPAAQRDAIVDTAKSDLDEVIADTPRLTISVTPRSRGVVVTLDGAVITAPLERSFDPGPHVVIATRAGNGVFRRDLNLERKAKVAVEVDVAPPPPVTLPRAEPPRQPPPEKSGPPVLGFVALGAGAAFAGLAVYSFAARGSSVSEYKAQCDTAAGCDPDLASPVRKWEAVGFTSIGLAVAGLGVGVYLIARPTPTPVAVSLGPGSLHIVGRF